MKSTDTTSPYEQLSLDVSRQVDRECTEFERALQRGELPSVEDIVSAASPEARQPLLRELLTLEMEFRAGRGESPDHELFRSRFPQDLPLVKYLYHEHFVPSRLADFTVQKLLGRGSYGCVYQGWDAKLTRHVALKVFRRDPMAPRRRGGALRTEARMVAQLRHPGIVTVFAVQEDLDGDEFLVLEYVAGTSLEELIRSERLTEQHAAQLILEVGQALQHAHQTGLVHRDLKPANILLDASGRPRVTDFGLALQMSTATARREIAGTVAYMAPEQASGETHRLNGRTDLWAAGVILYRMLAGQLPFTGKSKPETLTAIRYSEPTDLQQLVPSITPEFARIVRRCLAKRMSERYASAAELVDDLDAFLHAKRDNLLASNADSADSIAVVPKGLRCFDANDRDFFLSLVPGPRDRHGIPSTVLFWQRHLQQLSAHETFRVGLIYGPSGCGKSSLIRAGILPRLPGHIKSVVIEGARDETELTLMRELRRLFPSLSADLDLPESLRQLREGTWLAPGEKLVLVFDQFEQWLHGWRHESSAQLLEALRQCDGSRLQALILVRDDFWMPATRLFQHLDVPLVEGLNAAAVDLFDPAHAAKVLAAFGAAYGRLDAAGWKDDIAASQFVQRAVDELSEDGWIIPVRLCIFAEMVKSRPWVPATLQIVGGAQGLGASFLEEVFDGRSASPTYRLHRKAARLVLERLLPPPGVDIRGHLVSETDLLAISGYEHRLSDLTALLRCLDQELRLITPSDTTIVPQPAGAEEHSILAAPRLYQLTHDFLVIAIRGWLYQTRRRTLRGRAELRLSDYADAFTARQETRQLPPWWQWLGMLTLTQSSRWRESERTMMRRATRHHIQRLGLVAAVAVCIGAFAYDRILAARADGLVEALAISDSRDIPRAASQLTELRRRTRPRLTDRLDWQSQTPDQRTRILLGLLAVGDPHIKELSNRLLDTDPTMSVAIAQVLYENGKLPELEQGLWTVAKNEQQSAPVRLRACVALARLAPDSRPKEWSAIAGGIVPMLLRDTAQNPGHFSTWVEALLPLRKFLVPSLRAAFVDTSRPEAERMSAANILARYLAGDEHQLTELALEATPKQFEVITRGLVENARQSRNSLVQVVQSEILSNSSEDEKDRLAHRQSNALALLHKLGEEQQFWPALRHSKEPRVRSFLIDHLGQVVDQPEELLRELSQQSDPGVRQAIILILGSAVKASPSVSPGSALVERLLQLYRNDPDSGVHSAAEWALGRCGAVAQVADARVELANLGIRPDFTWYVTKGQITMIIIEPPGRVELGSPKSEPERDASDEDLWTCNIDWKFAISATEVTQAQYLAICPNYADSLNDFAPKPDCPVNVVSWLEAITFCRLLSEREGIPTDAMALPAVDQLERVPYPAVSTKSGYRLPREGEWEVACRAGTTTPRFFGYAPSLLPQYACYIDNSSGESRPVGQELPNGVGLFGMLGNVAEWCLDIYSRQPQSPASEVKYSRLFRYVVRGGDFVSNERMLRSANRRFELTPGAYSRGFRIAHTVVPPDTPK